LSNGNAIIDCKGGDEFVTASQSLHCGVRSVVHHVYENEQATVPCGVEVLESLIAVDVEENPSSDLHAQLY